MPRAPLTEEQKQVLRDRLTKARDAKAKKAAEPPTSAKGVDQPAPERRTRSRAPTRLKAAEDAAHSVSRTFNIHVQWTENQWMEAPIESCRARLSMLKVDFEVGSRITGQRNDVNDPTTYKCFVCHNPIPESKWVWKHDYLEHSTNLYKSIVICSQHCHTVYCNDTRLQMVLKDLIAGTTNRPLTEPVQLETE